MACTPDARSGGTPSESMIRNSRKIDTVRIDMVVQNRHSQAHAKSLYCKGFSQKVPSRSRICSGSAGVVRRAS